MCPRSHSQEATDPEATVARSLCTKTQLNGWQKLRLSLALELKLNWVLVSRRTWDHFPICRLKAGFRWSLGLYLITSWEHGKRGRIWTGRNQTKNY